MFLHVPQHGGSATGGIWYPGSSTSPDILKKQVRYGEARRVDMRPGDLVTLVAEDGGGPASLLALSQDGTPAFDDLGLGGLEQVSGAPALCELPELQAWIEARGGSATNTRCVRVFDEGTAVGERYVIRAEASCILWICLPRLPEAAAEGGGGTVSVEIAAARKTGEGLPEPLSEIRDEFRIERGTATAYRVAEGEYIQIIDIEGRQCSDFMAMRSSALDEGLERRIDSTVTRTLVGHAYPHPGLFDKF
ncbi:MAG: DUF1989 domain-containing protein, partial [Pirellulales bacterium]|nr:DUF1989 domain-containing protein [Pirellulales bacterium]